MLSFENCAFEFTLDKFMDQVVSEGKQFNIRMGETRIRMSFRPSSDFSQVHINLNFVKAMGCNPKKREAATLYDFKLFFVVGQKKIELTELKDDFGLENDFGLDDDYYEDENDEEPFPGESYKRIAWYIPIYKLQLNPERFLNGKAAKFNLSTRCFLEQVTSVVDQPAKNLGRAMKAEKPTYEEEDSDNLQSAAAAAQWGDINVSSMHSAAGATQKGDMNVSSVEFQMPQEHHNFQPKYFREVEQPKPNNPRFSDFESKAERKSANRNVQKERDEIFRDLLRFRMSEEPPNFVPMGVTPPKPKDPLRPIDNSKDEKRPSFFWMQGAEDLSVWMMLPQGTTKNEITVVVKPSEIFVKVGNDQKIAGKLWSVLESDSMTWTIEKGSKLEIVAFKAKKGLEWKRLLKDETLEDGVEVKDNDGQMKF